jgi:para-aminobenzoate synthetase component I
VSQLDAAAWFGGQLGTDLADVTTDIAALDSAGRWAVVVTFEGAVTCARFRRWRAGKPADLAGTWRGPVRDAYSSSLDQGEYQRAVEDIRSRIAAGSVYQANLCRVMTAKLPDRKADDVFALAALLANGNPAPWQGALRLPQHQIRIATASPELYLRRRGRKIESAPIKGTGKTPADITPKDEAENVMIVDLVRNDLGRVCETGSVDVPSLMRIEGHPGVVHLVSTVGGHLREGTSWPQLLDATFPPGSVCGAPKSSALKIIKAAETAPRGPYCGAIGWVDADAQTAELAVGIRTFWVEQTRGQPILKFGTGAGITWGSDPLAEWQETVLKSSNLTAVAAGEWT